MTKKIEIISKLKKINDILKDNPCEEFIINQSLYKACESKQNIVATNILHGNNQISLTISSNELTKEKIKKQDYTFKNRTLESNSQIQKIFLVSSNEKKEEYLLRISFLDNFRTENLSSNILLSGYEEINICVKDIFLKEAHSKDKTHIIFYLVIGGKDFIHPKFVVSEDYEKIKKLFEDKKPKARFVNVSKETKK